jgi:hypothetical protein
MDVALLRQIGTLPSYDAELANAFKAAPTVVVLSEAAGASATDMHVFPIPVRDAAGDPEAAEHARASLWS